MKIIISNFYLLFQVLTGLKTGFTELLQRPQDTMDDILTIPEVDAKVLHKNESDENIASASLHQQNSWWFQMVIFTIFVLTGQSIATILGRLYFDKGGKSMWMETLVFNAGFPVVLPLYLFAPFENNLNCDKEKPSLVILASVYLCLGIFLAAVSIFFAVGLSYLPVSTYTLICATQLGFNALFSGFLNSQKLTTFIVNSLVLLTISSVLLVYTPDFSDSSTFKNNYALEFLCTVGASAGYALILSLTQFSFQKIFKTETFRVVVDMIVYQCAVATCVVLVTLFVSGEWKGLSREMREFELGSFAYVMVLVCTAVFWQVFGIGAIALIYKVSSLFPNVISTLGLPIVHVLGVFIFNEKMSGVKVISMVLAVWGFGSYIYQHYFDDLETKDKREYVDEVSQPLTFSA